MKKKFTTMTVAMVSAFYFNLNAQTINLDTSFGNNGIVSIPLIGEADDLKIIESSDNKLLVFGKDIPSSISIYPNKIHKLNTNGTFDTSFGSGGTITLPNYVSDFTIVPQGSNKFLVTFQRTTIDSSSKISILRYDLATGQIDTTFGVNGEFTTNFDGSIGFRDNIACVLSDNSIIISTGSKFIKLLSNGTIDFSYGNNGIINHLSDGNIQLSNSDILNFYDTKIEKISTTGNLISSFGTNGTFTYQNPGTYSSKQVSDGSIYSLDIDGYNFNKISYNGASSNIVSLTTDNNTLEFYSNFDFAGDKIYFVGTTSTDSPFIVSYDNSGNLIPLNSQNSYKEIAIPTGNYTSILSKDNTLYVGGDRIDIATNKWYYVVTKYNITNSTLSTAESRSENLISFENPAKSNLVYSTKEIIENIKIYSTDGRLIKIVNKNNSDISELVSGFYLLKVEFKNGETVTEKILKK
ncbi:T9SS type A sorting domain-containing protein [Chryseobacterium sp. 2TAF14]|uniref:T9SS type A sorting domain-containing protein n=1 Tax=Chryseobacterium sp. 2TAF14 TaxID=3233007 RepID=UPI003F8D98BB